MLAMFTLLFVLIGVVVVDDVIYVTTVYGVGVIVYVVSAVLVDTYIAAFVLLYRYINRKFAGVK